MWCHWKKYRWPKFCRTVIRKELRWSLFISMMQTLEWCKVQTMKSVVMIIVYCCVPSSIYSWSIGHILEHEFFCLGHLGWAGSKEKKWIWVFLSNFWGWFFQLFVGNFFFLLPTQPKWPKQKNSCSKMWPIDQLYIELGLWPFRAILPSFFFGQMHVSSSKVHILYYTMIVFFKDLPRN